MRAMRAMRAILIPGLVGACTIKERDQKGPEIHIEMEQSFIQVGDQNPGESFMLGTDPNYSIAITITTIDGQEDDSTTLSYSPVVSINPVFTVPTVTVPGVTFTPGGSAQDVTYMASSPLVIPASAKGQTMTIHVDGKDGNGLASNQIDFTAKFE